MYRDGVAHAYAGSNQRQRHPDPKMQKSPRPFDLGLFHLYLVPRRRLNWAVRCPVYKGYGGGVSVRHTQGHTRPPVLGVCIRLEIRLYAQA